MDSWCTGNSYFHQGIINETMKTQIHVFIHHKKFVNYGIWRWIHLESMWFSFVVQVWLLFWPHGPCFLSSVKMHSRSEYECKLAFFFFFLCDQSFTSLEETDTIGHNGLERQIVLCMQKIHNLNRIGVDDLKVAAGKHCLPSNAVFFPCLFLSSGRTYHISIGKLW